MTLKPLAGYVLLEIEEAEGKTASGFVLPEESQNKPGKGRILAGTIKNGEQVDFLKDLDIGTVVVFTKWKETPVEENGKHYAFVKFEDIQGYYEENNAN